MTAWATVIFLPLLVICTCETTMITADQHNNLVKLMAGSAHLLV